MVDAGVTKMATTETIREFWLSLAAGDYLPQIKAAVPVLLLALFWCWETWRPFFGKPEDRVRHAARNLAIALCNTVLLGLTFGFAITALAHWTNRYQLGLLNQVEVADPVRFILALVLLDGWLYLWHRANHAIPLLWRFHRMHHSDPHMDVTTATRFHVGEHIGSALLRLALIPLLGLSIWELVVYDTLVIAVTQLHHANISLGAWDRWLRLLIVTPDLHKVHHSRLQEETDSNYATVLSFWDRLAGTLQLRANPHAIDFGLDELKEPQWQTVWGMLCTPWRMNNAGKNTLPASPLSKSQVNRTRWGTLNRKQRVTTS